MNCLCIPSEEDLLRQIGLTSTVVWGEDEITKKDLDRWLSNFNGELYSTDKERKLALLLLSNFVYYNRSEVQHLCRNLHRDFIHSFSDEIPDVDIAKFINDKLEKTMFYFLGNPSESSSHLLYLYRSENDLPRDIFLPTIDSIPASLESLVFIDDVAISGTQASDYFNDILPKIPSRVKLYLLTFITTSSAIKKIEEINIKVIKSIVLDDRNKCFSDKSTIFSKNCNCRDECKNFAIHYGAKLWGISNALGYKNGQYAFGFYYNTPDNTLPIFWSDNNGWKPIVKRYHKKYSGGIGGIKQRFL